jgi:hypothetical protein
LEDLDDNDHEDGRREPNVLGVLHVHVADVGYEGLPV